MRDGLVGVDDPFEREREEVAIEHRPYARRQVVFGVERPLGDGSSVGVGRLLAAGGIGIRVVIIVRPSAQDASVVFALLDNLLRKLHATRSDTVVGVFERMAVVDLLRTAEQVSHCGGPYAGAENPFRGVVSVVGIGAACNPVETAAVVLVLDDRIQLSEIPRVAFDRIGSVRIGEDLAHGPRVAVRQVVFVDGLARERAAGTLVFGHLVVLDMAPVVVVGAIRRMRIICPAT